MPVRVLGYGSKRAAARSGGVVREQVATVEKFLPWQIPQIQTEGINGGLVYAELKLNTVFVVARTEGSDYTIPVTATWSGQ